MSLKTDDIIYVRVKTTSTVPLVWVFATGADSLLTTWEVLPLEGKHGITHQLLLRPEFVTEEVMATGMALEVAFPLRVLFLSANNLGIGSSPNQKPMMLVHRLGREDDKTTSAAPLVRLWQPGGDTGLHSRCEYSFFSLE